MNDAFILAGIRDVAQRHIGWEGEIEWDMRLVEDLSLDSIKLLTLAMEVENHFKICLDPESDHELLTVGHLVAAIRDQQLANPEISKLDPEEGDPHGGAA